MCGTKGKILNAGSTDDKTDHGSSTEDESKRKKQVPTDSKEDSEDGGKHDGGTDGSSKSIDGTDAAEVKTEEKNDGSDTSSKANDGKNAAGVKDGEKKPDGTAPDASSASTKQAKKTVDLSKFDPPQKTRAEINDYQAQDRSDLLKYVMVELYHSAKDEGLYGQEDQDKGAVDDEDDDDDSSAKAGSTGSSTSSSQDRSDDDDVGSSTSSAPAAKKDNSIDANDFIDFDEQDDLLSPNRTDPVNPTPYADKADEILGYAGDALGLLNIGTTTMNLRELYPGTDSNNMPVSVDTVKDQQSTARKVFSGFSMLSGGIGAAQNVLGLYSNSKKGSVTKNQRKRKQAESGILQNGLGLFSNLIDITNSGIGLFGDENDTSQQNTVSALSFLGTIASAGSAYLGLRAGMDDKNDHKEIIESLSEKAVGNQNDWDNSEEKRLKSRLGAVKDKDSDDYKKAKMSLNAFKSKKYALQEAAEFHKIKEEQMTKGAVGAAVTGISTVGTMMNYIPGIKDSKFGKFVNAVNPLFSTVGGYAAKYSEKASDKIAEGKIKEKKKRIIMNYIAQKSIKLQEQANAAFKNHPDADLFKSLTQREKERIVVARMGVNVEISDQQLSENDMLKAFEIRNKKQAKAIMNSGKKNREEMLSALKLDSDASLEEIASALTGD